MNVNLQKVSSEEILKTIPELKKTLEKIRKAQIDAADEFRRRALHIGFLARSARECMGGYAPFCVKVFSEVLHVGKATLYRYLQISDAGLSCPCASGKTAAEIAEEFEKRDSEFVKAMLSEIGDKLPSFGTRDVKELEQKPAREKPRVATPVELEEQAINQEVADFLSFGENFCSFVATEKMEALRRTNSPDLERIRDGAAGVCARIDEILNERENERAKNGQY